MDDSSRISFRTCPPGDSFAWAVPAGLFKNEVFSIKSSFLFLRRNVEISFAFRTFNFRILTPQTDGMLQVTPMLSTKTLKENRHSSWQTQMKTDRDSNRDRDRQDKTYSSIYGCLFRLRRQVPEAQFPPRQQIKHKHSQQ